MKREGEKERANVPVTAVSACACVCVCMWSVGTCLPSAAGNVGKKDLRCSSLGSMLILGALMTCPVTVMVDSVRAVCGFTCCVHMLKSHHKSLRVCVCENTFHLRFHCERKKERERKTLFPLLRLLPVFVLSIKSV